MISPNDFCNWLSGCLDIMETKTLNTKQVEMIKEKLATVEGHQTSSLHAKKQITIPISCSEPIMPTPIVYPPIRHPDLGPEIQWQDKNPNWSGIVGQTNQISLQPQFTFSNSNGVTFGLNGSRISGSYNKHEQHYYEHHSDIPSGVSVSSYVGTKPAIGTYENSLPNLPGISNMGSYTYSNVPIKSYKTENVQHAVSFGHRSALENQSGQNLSHSHAVSIW